MPNTEQPECERETVVFSQISSISVRYNKLIGNSDVAPTCSNQNAATCAKVDRLFPSDPVALASQSQRASAASVFNDLRAAERSSKNEIPLPICKLPYYHGPGKEESLACQVQESGDFILFLNQNDHNIPTLLVRDDTHRLNVIPVHLHERLYYYFFTDDLKFQFNAINCLIEHYQNNSIGFGESKKAILRRGIKCSEYDDHLLLEMSNDVTSWTYRLPWKTPVAEIHEMLQQNGDYIVLADKSDQHILFVRWHEDVKSISFKPNQSGHWLLPRLKNFEPEETVKTLDCLIKSLAKSRHVFHDFCLIKPVKINSKQQECTTAMKCSFTAGNFTDCNTQAPRPIHALPFYYGKILEHRALKHLKNSGDYLVFINEKDENPYLATCLVESDETIYQVCKIKRAENNFYILKPSDAEKAFGTIEELVKYYEVHHVPVQAGTTDSFRSIQLQTPVYKSEFGKKRDLSGNYNDSRLCHGFIADSIADKLLDNSGDYLVRQRKSNGDYMLTVRWGDHCYDLIFEYDQQGLFALTRSDAMEPVEYVADFWDFIQGIVVGMNQLDHIVLKRLIPNVDWPFKGNV